jgi:hypothetical protein
MLSVSDNEAELYVYWERNRRMQTNVLFADIWLAVFVINARRACLSIRR